MFIQAKRNRTVYPEIEVRDSVNMMRKKGNSEKEKTSPWVRSSIKDKRIDKKLGQIYHHVDSDNTEYLRHELLKV